MKKLIFCLIFLLSLKLYGQQKNYMINGVVKTIDNQFVEYASVIIKGSNLITNTNNKGEFSFRNLTKGNYILIVRMVGYKPVEHQIVVENIETNVNIILAETANQLNEIAVKSYVTYRHDLSNLATRTSTPILEIPQSIQVLTQQILKDQQAVNINEVIRNIAGMATFSNYQDYTMRGFRSNDGNFAYNGVRGALYQFDIPGQLYNVEKIEAIKGPASSLFSNASPGGIINIVTKQPLSTKKYELQATLGTYGQKRFMADATGPLSSKLFYRFIVGYENSGAINEQQDISNLFVAPSFRYDISKKTSATVELNFYNDNRTIGYERGLTALQRVDGSYNLDTLPIRWSRHNPTDFSKTRGVSSQLRFTHKINNSLALNVLARGVNSRQEQQDHTSNFNSLVTVADGFLRNRSLQYFNQDPIFALQTNLYAEGKFTTGKIKHTLITGFDYANNGRSYYYASWGASDLNVLNPNFSSDLPLDKSKANKNFGGLTKENTILAGGYIQNQIDFSSKFKALLGLRYDIYTYHTSYIDDTDLNTTTRDTSDAQVFLPRLGLVYMPLANLSFYASYSQSFQPQFSNLGPAGGPFNPEKGVQYELGIKAMLLGGKLVPTLAIYDLRKSNILIPDINDINGIRQVPNGAAKSRGLELTVQGSLSPQLTLITNYAYNKTINLNGGEFGVTEGSLYPMAPLNTANSWLKYSFTAGTLKGLSLNAGIQYVDKRNTFTPDFVIPSFTTADAGLAYRFKSLNLSLNVYNISNERYYTGAYGRGIFWAGMPRSYRTTISYHF